MINNYYKMGTEANKADKMEDDIDKFMNLSSSEEDSESDQDDEQVEVE